MWADWWVVGLRGVILAWWRAVLGISRVCWIPGVVGIELMMVTSVREGVGVDEQLFRHQQQQRLGGAGTKGGQGVVLPRPAVGGVRAGRLSEDLPVGCHQRCRVADLVCFDHV